MNVAHVQDRVEKMQPTRYLVGDIGYSHDLQDFIMPARFYDWWHDVFTKLERVFLM